jgi:hypothetical protein
VTSIGDSVFNTTGTGPLTLILPLNAPTIEPTTVLGTTYSKTVTVKTPSGKSGYDTAWETNFKLLFGTNSTITLIFQDL